MWHATKDALDPAAPSFLAGTDIAEGSARQAAALLVLELAYADPVLTPADREAVAAHLRARWGIDQARRRPRPHGGGSPHPIRGLCRPVRQRVGRAQRIEFVERLWTVASAMGRSASTRLV